MKFKNDVEVQNSEIKISSTASAHLILNGDTTNIGDLGEEDAIVDFLHDNGVYGYRLNSENWSQKSAFNIQENISGTYTSRLYINKDGKVGIGTNNPESKLHVLAANVGVRSTYGTAMIESNDAQLDLVSSSDGTWGSSINLIQGNGTTNTNVWSIARTTSGSDNKLRFNFGTNNNHVNDTKVTFTEDGNVGIGTTTPTARLNLKSEGINKYVLRATRSSNGNDLFSFYEDGGGNCELYLKDSASTKILINSNGDSYFNGGDVGIGTTNPNVKLQVGDGTADHTARVFYSDGAYTEMRGYGLQFNRATSYIRPTSNNAKTMYFGTSSATWNLIRFDALQYDLQTNGVSRLKIDGTGKVGIGVTSPQAALNVNGNIKIEGTGAVWLGGGGSTPDWEIKASTNDLTIADIAGNDGSVFFDNSYGVALPRLTTTQINAMPASVLTQGLMAYNITLNTICFYNGSSWQKVSHSNM